MLKDKSDLSGFTLIEILVVVAIFVIVLGFALGVGSEFYRSQVLIAEKDNLVGLLRSARNQAMNNINQSSHGVFIDSNQYILFEGESYSARHQDFDEAFPLSYGVSIGGANEVVFRALDGQSSASGTITITNSRGTANIELNYEGRISW